jgi:Domain of unknown function (DUF397)
MRLFAVRGGRRSADDSSVVWVKSSLSTYNGNCVEVAGLNEDTIQVRNSKNPSAGVVTFTPGEWDAFIGGVLNGEFKRKPRE